MMLKAEPWNGRGPKPLPLPKDPLEHWNLMSAADIFAPLPPYPWLIPGLHVAPGRVTLLNGYANAGKTIVAMAIALAVATGRPVWGLFRPARVGRVLHMNGELGTYIARERYQRLVRGMGIDEAELVASENLVLANYPRTSLDDPAFEDEMIKLCAGVSLVIIDSLRAFSGGLDEKDKEIGVALLMLARVSDRTGATFLVLHHNRKPSQGDEGQSAAMTISGSSAIFGGCECAFVMAAKEKGAPVYVHHERSPIGKPLPDFGLAFEDVAKDNDARWGLRVVHLDGEQLEERAAVSIRAKEAAVLDKSGRAIVEALGRYAGHFRGSKGAFRAECGIGYNPFHRALGELISAGIVVQFGTYHHPEWRFAENLESQPNSIENHQNSKVADGHVNHPHSPLKGVGIMIDQDPTNERWGSEEAADGPPLERRGNLFSDPFSDLIEDGGDE